MTADALPLPGRTPARRRHALRSLLLDILVHATPHDADANDNTRRDVIQTYFLRALFAGFFAAGFAGAAATGAGAQE